MAMFNREEDGSRNVETIIGPSVKVEGNFVGSGNIVVEGVVHGSLKTSKDVRVGESAKIKADVEAANVTVLGEIVGNIRTAGKLDLGPAAKVVGNVEAAVLVVAQGALLNGKCAMLKSDGPAPTPVAAHPAPEKKRGA